MIRDGHRWPCPRVGALGHIQGQVSLAMIRDGCCWPCPRMGAVGQGWCSTLTLWRLGRLIIRNGNNVEAPPVYDSYEVEYLPIEGLLSTGRHFFVELTTDSSGAAAGMALRYEGTGSGHRGEALGHPHAPPRTPQTSARVPTAFEQGHCYEPFVKYGNFTASDPRYPVGTTVEFSCDPGYTLEQGSTIIECVDPSDPQWNETEPACRGGHRRRGAVGAGAGGDGAGGAVGAGAGGCWRWGWVTRDGGATMAWHVLEVSATMLGARFGAPKRVLELGGGHGGCWNRDAVVGAVVGTHGGCCGECPHGGAEPGVRPQRCAAGS